MRSCNETTRGSVCVFVLTAVLEVGGDRSVASERGLKGAGGKAA